MDDLVRNDPEAVRAGEHYECNLHEYVSVNEKPPHAEALLLDAAQDMVDADFSNMGDAFTAIRQKADETVRDWHARRFPRAVEEHALARQAKDIGSAAVWALVLADIFG